MGSIEPVKPAEPPLQHEHEPSQVQLADSHGK
jgi:hypothetical protein